MGNPEDHGMEIVEIRVVGGSRIVLSDSEQASEDIDVPESVPVLLCIV